MDINVSDKAKLISCTLISPLLCFPIAKTRIVSMLSKHPPIPVNQQCAAKIMLSIWVSYSTSALLAEELVEYSSVPLFTSASKLYNMSKQTGSMTHNWAAMTIGFLPILQKRMINLFKLKLFLAAENNSLQLRRVCFYSDWKSFSVMPNEDPLCVPHCFQNSWEIKLGLGRFYGLTPSLSLIL